MKNVFLISIAMSCGLGSSMLHAQNYGTSASQNWNSSYGGSSALERNTRLNFAVEQNKLNNGFYGPSTTTITTTNTYDRSISNNVNAAEGASVDLENRSAEGTGTSSYVVGAINTSTNNITTNGNGNTTTVSNTASSEAGCIDGGISSYTNRPVGNVDISAGAAVSGTGANTYSVSPNSCSR